MSISRYTARQLTESVINIGDGRENFLTSQYFSMGRLWDTKTIDFAELSVPARVVNRQRVGGMAVPVNGKVGQVKSVSVVPIRLSFPITSDFLNTLDPSLPSYTGPYMNPQNQISEKIARQQEIMRRAIERTIEVEAANALQSGTLTLTYEDGGTETVSYGYTTATVALSATGAQADRTIQKTLDGTKVWTSGTANPLGDLEILAAQIRDHSTYNGPMDVIMGFDAWAAFSANENVKKELDNRRIEAGVLEPVASALYKGTMRGMRFFQYSNGYVNAAGTRIQSWDEKKIVIVPRNTMGLMTIEYGAVEDFASESDNTTSFIRTDFFSKWNKSQDPPRSELIVESCPLPLVRDVKAIRVLQVIA